MRLSGGDNNDDHFSKNTSTYRPRRQALSDPLLQNVYRIAVAIQTPAKARLDELVEPSNVMSRS